MKREDALKIRHKAVGIKFGVKQVPSLMYRKEDGKPILEIYPEAINRPGVPLPEVIVHIAIDGNAKMDDIASAIASLIVIVADCNASFFNRLAPDIYAMGYV